MPRLDLIGLIVSDLEVSVGYYRRLGIEFPAPQTQKDMTTPKRLCREESASRLTPNQPLYKKLVQEGVESYKEPWDAFWGQRYAQAGLDLSLLV